MYEYIIYMADRLQGQHKKQKPSLPMYQQPRDLRKEASLTHQHTEDLGDLQPDRRAANHHHFKQ